MSLSTTYWLVSASSNGGRGVTTAGAGWGRVGASRSAVPVGVTGSSAVVAWPGSATVGSRLGDPVALYGTP